MQLSKNDINLLKPIFWDIDVNTLNIKEDKHFVIARILRFGRPEQLNWCLENFSEKDIIDTVKITKNIDRRTANFWQVHFNIPVKEISCLNNQQSLNYFS